MLNPEQQAVYARSKEEQRTARAEELAVYDQRKAEDQERMMNVRVEGDFPAASPGGGATCRIEVKEK